VLPCHLEEETLQMVNMPSQAFSSKEMDAINSQGLKQGHKKSVARGYFCILFAQKSSSSSVYSITYSITNLAACCERFMSVCHQSCLLNGFQPFIFVGGISKCAMSILSPTHHIFIDSLMTTRPYILGCMA
jgi:hypothetical protein